MQLKFITMKTERTETFTKGWRHEVTGKRKVINSVTYVGGTEQVSK
jgi:hypothetical protein